MEVSTASVLLAALAILVSVVSLIRTRHSTGMAAEMQAWTWRQKVGDELAEVSYLLTQSELATQREQRRHRAAEVQIDMLRTKLPSHPVIKETTTAIAASRAVAREQEVEYATFRKTLAGVWQSPKPTADQLAALQKTRSILRQTLARLEQFEAVQEANLKSLTENASKA